MTPRILLVVGSLMVGLVFAGDVATAKRGADEIGASSGDPAERDKGEKELRKAEQRAHHDAAQAARELAKDERQEARRDDVAAPPEASPIAAPPPATSTAAAPTWQASAIAESQAAGQPAQLSAPTPVAPTPSASASAIAASSRKLPGASFWPLPDPAPIERASAFGIGGAAAPGAPGWDPFPGATTDDGGRPWWLSLLWGLPILGVSGAGAVVIARRRQTREAVPDVVSVQMAPVAPRDLHGLLRNGQGAVAKGALEEALAWFDQALRVQPKLAVALFCKGVCLAALGRTSEAFGSLDAAARAAPDDTSYRVHLAHVALALGKHKEAMDALAVVTLAMPELGPAMLEDPKLAALRDHPRFLALCGAL